MWRPGACSKEHIGTSLQRTELQYTDSTLRAVYGRRMRPTTYGHTACTEGPPKWLQGFILHILWQVIGHQKSRSSYFAAVVPLPGVLHLYAIHRMHALTSKDMSLTVNDSFLPVLSPYRNSWPFGHFLAFENTPLCHRSHSPGFMPQLLPLIKGYSGNEVSPGDAYCLRHVYG